MSAKRRKGKQAKSNQSQDNLTQVDIYYLPSDQAELYKALRDQISQEVVEELEKHFPKVEVKTLDPNEGEAVVAYGDDGLEALRYSLSPTNIAQAQSSHDKEKMDLYVENLIKKTQ